MTHEQKWKQIETRVCARVWERTSWTVRGKAIDTLSPSVHDEILFRNNTRLTIWNRIPRSS